MADSNKPLNAPPDAPAHDPPNGPPPGSADAPIRAPKRRRLLRWILASIAAILLLAAGAAFVFRDPILRYLIKQEALALGVRLKFGDMDLRSTSLSLLRARIALDGVQGFDASVEEATITLASLYPPVVTKIDAARVVVRVEGSIADRAVELSAWSNVHAGAFQIPVTASDIHIEWLERADASPWLRIDGGALNPAAGGVTFRADAAELAGVKLGPALAAWTADRSDVSIGFGNDSPADAPLRIDAHPTATPPTADIRLSPQVLAELGAPMGLALPTGKATVEGAAALTFGPKPLSDAITGTVAMTLSGYTPPVPKELGGIVYGKKTTFTSALRLSEDRTRLTLSDATVTAGAFKLKGTGLVERRGDYAVISMNMAGSIPCADVARSAAAADLGDAIGRLAGDVARTMMEGSVAVTVRIDADTRDLANAKVTKDIGVGCGLKSLPKLLPKLPELVLPGLTPP